jgi:HAD superfamily hydrolase (TIGR01450 family)
MKAVILAAGLGTRLISLTREKPKCLIRVAGKSILDYQIDAYYKAGIQEIVIVGGYKINMIKEHIKKYKRPKIKILYNKDFNITNNMYSFYLARKEIEGQEIIVSNGDVVFDSSIIYDLVHSDEKDLIACDKGSYNDESMKIIVGPEGYVSDISKKISKEVAYGNSIDLYKFSQPSCSLLLKEASKIIEKEHNMKDWFEIVLQRLLIGSLLKMRPFDINKRPWTEIDNIEDLLEADLLFNSLGSLNNKKLFFIDLDGTVYLGDKPINGAKKFIEKLRKLNKLIYFLSNNSSKSKDDYVRKMNKMGIRVNKDEIVLSTDGVIKFLLDEKIKDIYVIGTRSMKKSFKEAGFNIDSRRPKYIVLGYDTEITYEKISRAAILMQKKVPLIATHCDLVCPSKNGPIPDIGSILAMLKKATNIEPGKIFGKPNKEMVLHILEKHNLHSDDCVLIGDRLYTDMKLAERIGCSFICVLSGETKREDIENSNYWPDLVVKNLGDLINLF